VRERREDGDAKAGSTNLLRTCSFHYRARRTRR
jgi:hypothetical protein